MSKKDEDYLDANSTTDVARIVMALASEVWVMRDRQIIIEHLMEKHGSVSSEQIDNFVPNPELAEKIQRERERFITLVAGAPIADVDRSVNTILERAGLRPHEEGGKPE